MRHALEEGGATLFGCFAYGGSGVVRADHFNLCSGYAYPGGMLDFLCSREELPYFVL